MKIIKYSIIFSLLVVLFPYFILIKASSDAALQPCNQIATVIFTERLKKANISAAAKAQLQQILNNLYLGYLVRQNGTEVFGRSGTDPKTIETYWQALKNGTADYDTNSFCLYTALKQNPKDIQDNKICIDTASLQSQPVNVAYCKQNLQNMYEACGAYGVILQNFLNQIDPKTFQPIAGEDGTWQTNYVTFHLQKAIARLAATSSMVCSGMNCTPKFTGDVRDRGMIVNIQNNTEKNFAIIQSTLDDQEAKQIGMLKPGLNNVNLHLASLQVTNATAQDQSSYKFDVVEIGSAQPEGEQFSIKVMSGAELLAFLKSINKNSKGLFYMNGRLIAPKYAVTPEGLFLVLVKMPKNPTAAMMAYDKTADQSFPIDQRIQVVALNNDNPYFLTMQINEDEVEYEATKDAKEKSKATILQPSFFSIQSLPGLAFSKSPIEAKKNTANTKKAKTTAPQPLTHSLPPIILPDWLSSNESLHIYTTILQTAYIASLTDFAFFNQKCFANDMMCYNLLGYFDKANQRRFVLNLFEMYLSKKQLRSVKEIDISTLFETNQNSYYDIPQLYLGLNSDGNLTANEIDSLFFNLKINLLNELFANLDELNFFGKKYKIPFQNDLMLRIPIIKLKENVFVFMDEVKSEKYSFSFKDKDDILLGKYIVYPFSSINKINIEFLGENKKWLGTEVFQELINFTTGNLSQFKINYIYDSSKKQYQLYTSSIRPIDKIKLVHSVEFSDFPIKSIYLDLYNTYEISTIYRCIVTDNGILPSFLQSLSLDDWKLGIYMITEVKNNNNLTPKNPGKLTVTFYHADGNTKLGQLVLEGKSEDTGKIGIIEPVHAYNLSGRGLFEVFNIFLTTGILLKYKSNK